MEFLNPCICCLLRPSDKDIKTPYTCLGITEIYSVMIEGCFMIQLSLGNNDRCGICEECVGRLRDARDFKLQVQRSQAELRARLDGSLQARDFETTKAEITDDKSSDILSLWEAPSVKSVADKALNDDDAISHSSDTEPVCPGVKSETSDEEIGDADCISLFPVPDKDPVSAPTVPSSAPAQYMSALARRQLAMTCSVRLERLRHDSQATHADGLGGHEGDTSTSDACGQQFSRKLSLIKHIKRHYERLPKKIAYKVKPKRRSCADDGGVREEREAYTCATCGKKFSQKFNLIRHIESHMQQNLSCKALKKCPTGNYINETNKPYTAEKRKITSDKNNAKNYILKEHKNIHSGLKPCVCDICERWFTTKSALIPHLRIHTGQKTYSCESCDMKFMSKSRLTAHRRMHEDRPYTCEVCNMKFKTTVHLTIHRRSHTNPAENPNKTCEVCNKQFKRNCDLNRHKTAHTKPFTCYICNKRFTKKYSLVPHMKIHMGQKSHSCEYCHLNCVTKSQLTIHRRIHTGERPYSCEVCETKFNTISHLKKHRQIHTGEKPFSCDVCHRLFARQYTLTVHKRVHTSNNKFTCEKCPRQFKHKTDFTQHVLSNHKGVKPFACGICNKHFTQQRYANLHKKNMHTRQKPSSNVKKNESSSGDILNDQFFLCDTCGKKFGSKFGLTRHIQKQHMEQETPFCEICDKMFLSCSILRQHKRVHT